MEHLHAKHRQVHHTRAQKKIKKWYILALCKKKTQANETKKNYANKPGLF